MHNVTQPSQRPFTLLTLALLTTVAVCASCAKSDSDATTGHGSKNVLTLTKANWEAEVTKSSQPVLVDFWASWCGPCKMIAPVVADLAGEFEGRAKVGKVDVDAQPELAKQYGISAIPALLFFKDGKQVDQMIGVREKAELKAKLERLASAGN
jgi:thioredoxin 1